MCRYEFIIFSESDPATYVMSCLTSTFQFTVVSCRARQEGTRHSFGHLFLPLTYNILIFCRSDKILLFMILGTLLVAKN